MLCCRTQWVHVWCSVTSDKKLVCDFFVVMQLLVLCPGFCYFANWKCLKQLEIHVKLNVFYWPHERLLSKVMMSRLLLTTPGNGKRIENIEISYMNIYHDHSLSFYRTFTCASAIMPFLKWYTPQCPYSSQSPHLLLTLKVLVATIDALGHFETG